MNKTTLPIRSTSGVLRAGVIAAAFAISGNVIIYLVSSKLFNVPFSAPAASERFTITIIHVIVETLLLATGATLIFGLLCRFTIHAGKVFQLIAVIVLLVSFIFPLTLSVEPPMKVALSLTHIFSAIVIVNRLTRSPYSVRK